MIVPESLPFVFSGRYGARNLICLYEGGPMRRAVVFVYIFEQYSLLFKISCDIFFTAWLYLATNKN